MNYGGQYMENKKCKITLIIRLRYFEELKCNLSDTLMIPYLFFLFWNMVLCVSFQTTVTLRSREYFFLLQCNEIETPIHLLLNEKITMFI